MKQKKISTKFYANEDLKPKSIIWRGEKTTVYPLYCRVTYNRNNTKFRVLIDGQSVLVSTDLDQVKCSAALSKKLSSLESLVRNIIRQEASFNPKYQPNSFIKAIKKYTTSIAEYALSLPMCSYVSGIQKIGSTHALNVFTCLEILKNDFGDMTVFDWLDGGSKEFETAIRDEYKLTAASSLSKLIDHLIKDTGYAQP